MARICVFCGEKPVNKNNEHIIPTWLIELVNPELKAFPFYPFLNRETRKIEEKSIPWSAITFPACTECNTYFGRLESATKSIITALINVKKILVSSMDITTLFDWLSKMRIGMWMAYMYYLEYPFEEGTDNSIMARMHMYDRAMIIYKLDTNLKGIHFTGPGALAYQWLPTIFGMRINDYYFLNISTESLVSKNLGFPYVKKMKLATRVEAEFVEGEEKISPPIIRYLQGEIFDQSIKIYQPVYGNQKRKRPSLYETTYVRENSLLDGIGAVFIDNTKSIIRLERNTLYHIPVTPISGNIWQFFDGIFVEILGLYIQEYRNLQSMTEYTEHSLWIKQNHEEILRETEQFHQWAQENEWVPPNE